LNPGRPLILAKGEGIWRRKKSRVSWGRGMGAECWYETLKAQNRVNFTAKGDVLMAHETGGQGVNTAGK